MLLCWSLVLCCASLVLSLPRPNTDDANAAPSPDVEDVVSSLLRRRDARSIRDRTSSIYWIYPHLALPKDADGIPPSKVFNIRRWRRSFPASDDVSDTDVAQWTRKSPPKTEFITSHRAEKGDDVDPKNNEVEPAKGRSIASRVDSGEPVYRPPHRRIIYYANLPEINSRDRSAGYGPAYHGRYEHLPPGPKYPRESSYEGRARSHPLFFERPYDRTYDRSYDRSYDRYPNRYPVYRQAGVAPSYTIVDAEAPRSNTFDSPSSKYNKIPSPYRQGDYPGRLREPLGSQGATLVRNEPYRDYNPRQPAPWSVQIGTKLTVKDDERGFRPDVGQRRFYVNSQEPPRFNRVDRSRYNYAT